MAVSGPGHAPLAALLPAGALPDRLLRLLPPRGPPIPSAGCPGPARQRRAYWTCGQTALTAASLRVELEATKHQAREAQRENRALKERLARALGEEIAAEHPEHGTDSSAVSRLQAEVDRLLAAQVELRTRLRDTEEELDGARRLNRTLMRERNTAGIGAES